MAVTRTSRRRSASRGRFSVRERSPSKTVQEDEQDVEVDQVPIVARLQHHKDAAIKWVSNHAINPISFVNHVDKDSMYEHLRSAVVVTGGVLLILVILRGFSAGSSSLAAIFRLRNDTRSKAFTDTQTSDVAVGKTVSAGVDIAFVRAIAEEEAGALLLAFQPSLNKLEKSLAMLEAESKKWMDVLELDKQADIDPIAHTVLSKVERTYKRMRQDGQEIKVASIETSEEQASAKVDANVAILETNVKALARKVEFLESDLSMDPRSQDTAAAPQDSSVQNTCIDEKDARLIVSEMLDIYAADVIGLPDYALASVGATIERRKGMTSQDFLPTVYSTNPIWWFYSVSRPAEAAIDGDLMAGNCWACAIDGPSQCKLTVRFNAPALVSAVSVDHISPKIAFDMRSAPKRFRVYGVRGLPQGDQAANSVMLGEFEYAYNSNVDEGESHMPQVQTFQLEEPMPEKFLWVTFEFLENHGHPDWTCIYRVRVH